MEKADTDKAEMGPARRGSRRSFAAGLAVLFIAVAVPLAEHSDQVPRHQSAPSTYDLDATPISVSSVSTAEAEFVRLLNISRVANGKSALVVNSDIAQTSRTWSGTMSRAGAISHDPNLAAIMSQVLPSWTRAGENVGVGYDVAGLDQAFWNSPGHRANVLGDFNQVGVGVVYTADGRLWVTLRFAQGDLPTATSLATVTSRPDRVGIRRSSSLYLRSSLTSGPADLTFSYGTAADKLVMGDWNADGISTPGVFRNGTWYLRNSNTGGAAQLTFSYGQAGDVPVVGDWDRNGTDTVGVWRAGHFLLRNANTSGAANIDVAYGQLGDTPIVGDWDGNGTDTIGVWRAGHFLLKNANTGGAPNIDVGYGRSTDTPIAGDWDGNGTSTVGVRRSNAFYLRNANSGGSANVSFGYGTATDAVVVGGW